jgi:anthranilate synthase component 1
MSSTLTSFTVQPDHCDPLYLLKQLGATHTYCALLESVDRHHGTNDLSFLALGAKDVISTAQSEKGNDVLTPFEPLIGQGKEGGFLQMGYIGYISYESVTGFEDINLPVRDGQPDSEFFLPEVLIRMDHKKREVTVTAHSDTSIDLEAIKQVILSSPPFPDNPEDANLPLPSLEDIAQFRQMSRDEYCSAVRSIQEGILDGETFQVVLSQELQMPIAEARRLDSVETRHGASLLSHRISPKSDYPLLVYEKLRAINPSPYMYYCRFPERSVVGASPETLIRVDGRTMTYRPIAGTRRRTGNPTEDEGMKRELLADQKERCEHQMLVDLGRNDLGRVAEIGSVQVSDPFHIEAYSHVFHIVSDITGTLKKGKTSLDALRAVFPAGTLTGAPKVRAMEVIRSHEVSPRGIYGGAIGYIDLSGNLDMAIAIRTLVFEKGQAFLRTGAGIVKDSVPELEDNECLHKARSCLAALRLSS